MATEIVLPQWGMEMQDGTIVKWLKKEGDLVEEGEPIVEVETAKIQTELESTASGILVHIMVAEGTIVPVRGLLAIVADPGEEVPRPGAASIQSPPVQGGVAASSGQGATGPAAAPRVDPALTSPPASNGDRVQVVPAARRLAQERGVDLGQVSGTGPRGRIMIADVERAVDGSKSAATVTAPLGIAATPGQKVQVQVVPAARRLARERRIDLTQVPGTGPMGRILIADVERAVPAPVGAPDQAMPQTAPQTIPMEGIRRTIATRMLQSLQTMAQVTLTTEANVTDAMNLRAGISRQWTEQNLSPMHLAVKAAARALKDHPRLNAIQGEDQVQVMEEVNIGVAVSLPEGLITPVIRNVDQKTLAQIATEARELASRTREGRARPEDVTGGSFTVSNLGAYEVDAFTPIINPPQVAILGVGRVVEKPIILQGEITKGAMMYLSLTFDHRVVDGAPAAEFLQKLKGYLEDPWWMVA
jgi:pyruvate dehydrogenase E2 component (dihydrolipoamide acetyltransferase)